MTLRNGRPDWRLSELTRTVTLPKLAAAQTAEFGGWILSIHHYAQLSWRFPDLSHERKPAVWRAACGFAAIPAPQLIRLSVRRLLRSPRLLGPGPRHAAFCKSAIF